MRGGGIFQGGKSINFWRSNFPLDPGPWGPKSDDGAAIRGGTCEDTQRIEVAYKMVEQTGNMKLDFLDLDHLVFQGH